MPADFADKLADQAGLIATEVTERMVDQHPEMFEAFRRNLRNPGKTPEEWCTEDTVHHLEHLSAALDASPKEFAGYRAWLTGMLAARGIAAQDVERDFVAIAWVLERRYGAEANEAVRMLLTSGY